ncbi:MAG: zf-HC2 domain-containing protein [Rubrobacter sp.]|nr:zf-HC2 domain-containing protein [Rubrobacter sp.]
MSACGESDAFGDALDGCGCDPEKVFELVDGSLRPEQQGGVREHLASCPGCQELYEREVDLNAYLSSLDFSGMRSRSVCQGVAMALPTRPAGVRVLWGVLASALFVAALITLELNGAEPVLMAMSILGTFWGLVVGSADVARAVFAAAGSTILLALALGAVMDVLIALAIVTLSRGRRAREA